MRAVLIVNPNATSTTPAGRDLVDAAFADLVGVERAMLADLSAEDREQLAQRLRALLIALG